MYFTGQKTTPKTEKSGKMIERILSNSSPSDLDSPNATNIVTPKPLKRKIVYRSLAKSRMDQEQSQSASQSFGQESDLENEFEDEFINETDQLKRLLLDKEMKSKEIQEQLVHYKSQYKCIKKQYEGINAKQGIYAPFITLTLNL